MSDQAIAAAQAAETAAAQRDIGAFDAALRHSGVDATRQWDAVRVVGLQLDSDMSQVLDSIKEVQESPYMPEVERASRLDALRALGESAIRTAQKDHGTRWPEVDNLLTAAAMSDLQEADPGERQFIHAEMESYIRANPRLPVVQSLMNLAQKNPGRYAAAAAGTFGEMKLAEAGESRVYADFRRNLLLITPGATPKAQAARAAIPMAARAKAHTSRAIGKAQDALAAALTPKPTRGYRPDSIVPRRTN